MKVRMLDGSGSRDYRYVFIQNPGARVYFQRERRPPNNTPRIRLREEPGSDAFDAEYKFVFKGGAVEPPQMGRPRKVVIERAVSNTLRWLVEEYFTSRAWKDLDADKTQPKRRRMLESICGEIHPKRGEAYGNLPLDQVNSAFISVFRDSPDAFSTGNERVKACRSMFAWAALERPEALTAQQRSQNPAAVPLRKPTKPGGHDAWKESDAQKYEAKHVLGTKARFTTDLLFYTGARICDVVRLGPLNVINGKLCWKEWKGRNRHPPKEHALPIVAPLQASLDAYMATRGNVTSKTFLTTKRSGGAYSEHDLAEALRGWRREALLPEGLSAHGCRKLAAIRCAKAGVHIKDMMAIFGWRTEKQALFYIEQAQKELFEERGAHGLVPVAA
jgi:integrase